KIKEHRGRIARVLGDGILAEFASVIDAVRCAVEVQRSVAERNANAPQDKRIEFRIGINFGELIIEHGDFWGDGVNIAARLEALAHPGGIECRKTPRENWKSRSSLWASRTSRTLYGRCESIAFGLTGLRSQRQHCRSQASPRLPSCRFR